MFVLLHQLAKGVHGRMSRREGEERINGTLLMRVFLSPGDWFPGSVDRKGGLQAHGPTPGWRD